MTSNDALVLDYVPPTPPDYLLHLLVRESGADVQDFAGKTKDELITELQQFRPQIIQELKEEWPYQGSRSFFVHKVEQLTTGFAEVRAVLEQKLGRSFGNNLSLRFNGLRHRVGEAPDGQEKLISLKEATMRQERYVVVSGMYPQARPYTDMEGAKRYIFNYRQFNLVIQSASTENNSGDAVLVLCDRGASEGNHAVESVFNAAMFPTEPSQSRLVVSEAVVHQRLSASLSGSLWKMVRGQDLDARFGTIEYNSRPDEALTPDEENAEDAVTKQSAARNDKRAYIIPVVHADGYVERMEVIFTFRDRQRGTRLTFKKTSSRTGIRTLVEILFL